MPTKAKPIPTAKKGAVKTKPIPNAKGKVVAKLLGKKPAAKKAAPKVAPKALTPKPRVGANVIDLLKSASAREAVPNGNEKLVTMCERLLQVREEMDELKRRTNDLKEEHDALSDHEIPVLMKQLGYVDENNKGSRSLPNGSTVYLAPENQVSISLENRPNVIKWAQHRKDLSVFVKPDIHPSRLRSVLLQLLEEGREKEIPPEVTIFKKTVARVRRATKRKGKGSEVEDNKVELDDKGFAKIDKNGRVGGVGLF